MGLVKNLAIGFGIAVSTPVAAGALYLLFNNTVLYECRTDPLSAMDKSGAKVVRWNLPPLIGQRSGTYGVAYLTPNQRVFYAQDSGDSNALINKAKTFCRSHVITR